MYIINNICIKVFLNKKVFFMVMKYMNHSFLSNSIRMYNIVNGPILFKDFNFNHNNDILLIANLYPFFEGICIPYFPLRILNPRIFIRKTLKKKHIYDLLLRSWRPMNCFKKFLDLCAIISMIKLKEERNLGISNSSFGFSDVI